MTLYFTLFRIIALQAHVPQFIFDNFELINLIRICYVNFILAQSFFDWLKTCSSVTYGRRRWRRRRRRCGLESPNLTYMSAQMRPSNKIRLALDSVNPSVYLILSGCAFDFKKSTTFECESFGGGVSLNEQQQNRKQNYVLCFNTLCKFCAQSQHQPNMSLRMMQTR